MYIKQTSKGNSKWSNIGVNTVVVLEQVVVVLVGEQGVLEQAVVALAGERGVVGIVTAGEQVDMTPTRQEVHAALMAGE